MKIRIIITASRTVEAADFEDAQEKLRKSPSDVLRLMLNTPAVDDTDTIMYTYSLKEIKS